jgi:hypothetical protein
MVLEHATPFLFLVHVPATRSGYRELGLELVSLEDNSSRQPKRPPMVEEKKNEGVEDPIKLFLAKSLTQQRNEIMGNFPKSFNNCRN